jgi:hypothetical protein
MCYIWRYRFNEAVDLYQCSIAIVWDIVMQSLETDDKDVIAARGIS